MPDTTQKIEAKGKVAKAGKPKATPLTDEQKAAVAAASALWRSYNFATEQAALVATVLGKTTLNEENDLLVARLFKGDVKARNAFLREVASQFPKEWQALLDGSRLQLPQRAALLSAVAAYRYIQPPARCKVLLALRGEKVEPSWVVNSIVAQLPTPKMKERFYSLRDAVARLNA